MKGYDYSRAEAYFVTVCAWNRECMFGNVANGAMVLNATGQVVADEWLKSAGIRNEIELDECVVMPNHLHTVVFIVADRRGDRPVALP